MNLCKYLSLHYFADRFVGTFVCLCVSVFYRRLALPSRPPSLAACLFQCKSVTLIQKS